MTSAGWESLRAELIAHDHWGDFATPPSWPGIDPHPVNLLVNSNISATPYQNILIRYLDCPMQPAELEMVVRALTRKEMTRAVDRLLRFFGNGGKDSRLLWAVGNALHTIAPRDRLQEVIAICRNKVFGGARGRLVLHLSRFKKSEEVFQTLLWLLDDESVRGEAFEALWRYGDVRAIPAIEVTPVREGYYEAKAKNTALRRLNRKKK